MEIEFNYRILLISSDLQVSSAFSTMVSTINIQGQHVSSIMDGLEYLMDFNVDLILIDSVIGQDECKKFLHYIHDDYENKMTPLVILAQENNHQPLLEDLSSPNIISVVSNVNWHIEVSNLLRFLRLQKLNTHFMQSSLVESESRGTLDQLTGAYNRYGCEDIFQTLASRSKAYQEPFTLMIIDIDHFKKVNDTYGHDIGDTVLQSFSRIMMDSIRKDDSLIRFGGEEFIIFLSNVSKNLAIKNAENIRSKLEATLHSSHKLKITASFGLVEYAQDEDLDNITKRADELLYIAKSSGRNKVVSEKTA